MIENVLHELGGIGLYGLISICLFFAVFVGVIVWTLCLTRRYVNEMGHLPLDDASTPKTDTDASPKPGESHE
jgi:hypothetical protein